MTPPVFFYTVLMAQSWVWNHFTKSDDGKEVICKVCSFADCFEAPITCCLQMCVDKQKGTLKYHNNTSAMISHLKGKHNVTWAGCHSMHCW